MSRSWRDTRKALATLLVFSMALPLQAQERIPAAPVPSLRADAALARKLDAARDCIREQAWIEATYLLQALLDLPEDSLVDVPRSSEGQTSRYWTGIRGEAERLLAALPPEGREFYLTRYAPRAEALMAEARQKHDMNLVAEVARRYAATPAGGKAAALVAAHHLDRGRDRLAALVFAKLLERRALEPLPHAIFYQAAVAFSRIGDAMRTEQAWTRLATAAPDGMRIGDRDLSLAQLKRELDGPRKAMAMTWTASALTPPPPGLEARWSQGLIHESLTRNWLMQAASRHEERTSQPLLPACYPLLLDDRIIYRSYRGLHAVHARTGDEIWEKPSEWSMERLASKNRSVNLVESWIEAYVPFSPHVLFEHAVLGTLTTDGTRVYAVDDLGVPPIRTHYGRGGRFRQEPPWPDFGPGLTEAAYHNRLIALDAHTGQLCWQVGGYLDDAEEGDWLSDSYFLGPPLALDGRLYGIIERHHELNLVCLQAVTGELLWKQPLAFAPARMLLDPGRRLQCARPVYAQGLLVCPTNAGVVMAVDLATLNLAWAYPYRTQLLTQSISYYSGRGGRARPAQVIAEWKAPATVVHDGRVVFTTPDDVSIHCLNLRDGSLAWKVERSQDDLLVAGVFDRKVLVAGTRSCRALALDDGRKLWQRQMGRLAGQGAAQGKLYYMPVHELGTDTEPFICAIDIDRGNIAARIPVTRKDMPGNLFLWNGQVYTQSATALMAYTLRPEKPKEEKTTEEPSKEKNP